LTLARSGRIGFCIVCIASILAACNPKSTGKICRFLVVFSRNRLRPALAATPATGCDSCGAHRPPLKPMAPPSCLMKPTILPIDSLPVVKDKSSQSPSLPKPNGVGALQPAHTGHQIGLGRFQYQMVMIAHQAISMHLPAGFLAGFRQSFNEILPVHVVQEDILPPIAPAHDVIQRARILHSKLSWHGS
jgi:hypothetical protein